MDLSQQRCSVPPQCKKDPSRRCPDRTSPNRIISALKIFGVLVLGLLLISNLLVAVLLWGTNFVEEKITQGMVIENNTRNYDWWVKSPIQPYMQVRMFNYTNVDTFMAGDDDTLHIEEVGPYVYKETMERVNVQFHDNGTVSYQEKRSFLFSPERSEGSLDDKLTVPNMVMLGTASIIKNTPYSVRWFLSSVFSRIDAKPFITKTAREIFWGYDDPLFSAAKTYFALQGKADENKKLGLLVSRNGTSSSRVSIHTGALDITRLGLIDRYAGMNKFTHWKSDECNRIDGTDGSMFPPGLVSENSTLHMFMTDMCRKFPFVFKEYVTSQGSGELAMRFHPPRNVFDNSLAENSCYCHSGPYTPCLPSGVFNASPCAFNTPLMFSFPHFYLGDPVLREPFTGLAPDPAKHDMFLDIHPKFGFPVAGESRFQVNMMVQKSYGVGQLDQFDDDTILPIAWFEVVINEVPPEVKKVLRDLRFATVTVKWIAFWSFLTLFVMSTLVLGFYLAGRRQGICFHERKALSIFASCSQMPNSIPAADTKADAKAGSNPGS